jgi:hypothetical protein
MERIPAQVFPLAEYLCDELVARDWHTADCARRFDNGLSQAVNLLALNLLMLGANIPAPDHVIEGLANALSVSKAFLRSLERPALEHPDRVARWICPIDVLSKEQRDFVM